MNYSPLSVSNSRTTLLFLLAPNVVYLNVTDDLWFSAHKPVPNNSTKSVPQFMADEPAAVIGCATSRLFCNPRLPATLGCWNAFSQDSLNELQRVWPDPLDQISLLPLTMIIHQLDAVDIGAIFRAKSVPTLLARTTLDDNLQRKHLLSKQWQLEMEYLSQAMLAAVQHYMVDYARGFWADPGFCELISCQRLCHSQVS